MRLPNEDRKDVEKVKKKLYYMNSKGNAVFELNKRNRLPSESPETYAYKISELVKYAYPTLEQTTRDTITKDYFIQGLETEMQFTINL